MNENELTVGAAAAEAGVSKRLIRHYIAKGVLLAEKRSYPMVYEQVWAIDRASFEDWKVAREARLGKYAH